MAQEVQTTLDYRAELNEIEGIGYQQRKVSDKMQVRDKWTNSSSFISDYISISSSKRYLPTGWTRTAEQGGVTYKLDGEYIIIPTAGAYLVEITPPFQGYSQTNYFYDMELRVSGEVKFSRQLAYADHAIISITLNLGKKDRVTIALKAVTSGANGNIGLNFIKL